MTNFLEKCEIWIEKLKCYEDGETGNAEPYLWVAYFKIDYENVVLEINEDLIAKFVKKQGISHYCHVYPKISEMTSSRYGHRNIGRGWTDGKEKNLKNRSFSGFKPFYKNLGELHQIDINFVPFNWTFSFSAPFFIGCVVVLMEEDGTPNDAIFAGAKEFVGILENKLDDLFEDFELDVNEYLDTGEIEIPEEMLEALSDDVKGAIKTKIRNYFYDHSNLIELIAGGSDPDDSIGSTSESWLSNNLFYIWDPISWRKEWDLTDDTWNDGKWKIYGKTLCNTKTVSITDVSFRLVQKSAISSTDTLYSTTLTFNMNIDRTKLLPKYTIKIRRPEIGDWEVYQDPEDDNFTYSNIDCSFDNNPITVPINIILDATSLTSLYRAYLIDFNIIIEHPDVEYELQLGLWGPPIHEFEVIPFKDIYRFEYMLRTKGIPGLGPNGPELITDARLSSGDLTLIDQLPINETEKFWKRRIGMFGNTTGDNSMDLSSISVSYHLGLIKSPVYIFVHYTKLKTPITWTATLEKIMNKGQHKITKKIRNFNPNCYNIIDDPELQFNRTDYDEDNKIIFTVTARDGEGQVFEESYTQHAKSLIIKYDFNYAKSQDEVGYGDILKRTADYINRYHLPNIIRKSNSKNRQIFKKNKKKIRDSLGMEIKQLAHKMLSEDNLSQFIRNKKNELQKEFIDNIVYNLTIQKNIEMLNSTMKERNKNLIIMVNRKISKILANKMFSGRTKYHKEFKEKFDELLKDFKS